jgi:hypothetical protein
LEVAEAVPADSATTEVTGQGLEITKARRMKQHSDGDNQGEQQPASSTRTMKGKLIVQ